MPHSKRVRRRSPVWVAVVDVYTVVVRVRRWGGIGTLGGVGSLVCATDVEEVACLPRRDRVILGGGGRGLVLRGGMRITVRVQFNEEITVVVRVHIVAVRVLRVVATVVTVLVGAVTVTKETAVVVTVTVTVSSAGSIPAGDAMEE